MNPVIELSQTDLLNELQVIILFCINMLVLILML